MCRTNGSNLLLCFFVVCVFFYVYVERGSVFESVQHAAQQSPRNAAMILSSIPGGATRAHKHTPMKSDTCTMPVLTQSGRQADTHSVCASPSVHTSFFSCCFWYKSGGRLSSLSRLLSHRSLLLPPPASCSQSDAPEACWELVLLRS